MESNYKPLKEIKDLELLPASENDHKFKAIGNSYFPTVRSFILESMNMKEPGGPLHENVKVRHYKTGKKIILIIGEE